MQIVLTGFTHDIGFRVFTFERMEDDRTRTKWTVRAEMALVHKHGIPIQELPLLCRGLLERSEEDGRMPAMTFSEDEMQTWSDQRTIARSLAAAKKKPPHRPANENLGAAWRAQHS